MSLAMMTVPSDPPLDKEHVCWASSQYGMHPSSIWNKNSLSNYCHKSNIVCLPIRVQRVELLRQKANQGFMQRVVL